MYNRILIQEDQGTSWKIDGKNVRARRPEYLLQDSILQMGQGSCTKNVNNIFAIKILKQ